MSEDFDVKEKEVRPTLYAGSEVTLPPDLGGLVNAHMAIAGSHIFFLYIVKKDSKIAIYL